MERLSRCKCGHEDIEESVGEPFENRHVSILGAHEVSSRSWLHPRPKAPKRMRTRCCAVGAMGAKCELPAMVNGTRCRLISLCEMQARGDDEGPRTGGVFPLDGRNLCCGRHRSCMAS